MNVKSVLRQMEERMFNQELFDTLLEAHKQEVAADHVDPSEIEYAEGEEVLSRVLSEEEKQALSEMVDHGTQNIKFAVRFGFTRGLYAGFQQCFSADCPTQPFAKFVENQLLQEPNMRAFYEYYKRRCAMNAIDEALESQLDKVLMEHVTSISSGLDDRLYGVLRHAFYLGYRYALSVAEDVEPLASRVWMTERTLLTEHELAFTLTVEERERLHRNCQAKEGEHSGESHV